jgi:hypothetical protein
LNLHAIVGPIVAAVNPWVSATIQVSTGSTTDAAGKRGPSYAAPVPVQVQMQSLTYQDLVQISGMNIQGERRAMYVNGNWAGVVRPDGKGGDLITLEKDGSVWLVAQVLENWYGTDGWVKVCVTRQVAP